MVRITFVQADGREQVIDAQTGQSLMESAKGQGIDGIVAECGGSMICGTCHVHVAQSWLDRLPAAGSSEATMLEYVRHPAANARLSCQIRLTDDLDGLEVHVPPSQH